MILRPDDTRAGLLTACALAALSLPGCSNRSSAQTDPAPLKQLAAPAAAPSASGPRNGHTNGQYAVAGTPAPVPSAVNKNAISSVWKGAVLKQVATKQKVFALTFDDGPEPVYTPQILAILRANHVRATFFMVGEMVKSWPATARRVKDSGHIIGNHTWTHPTKTRDAAGEVRRTDAVLHRILGRTPVLFRPPYGLMTNGVARVAESDGQTVVLWSASGADWAHGATAGGIASQIIKGATPGGIALLHDGGGNRSATVAALPRIIRELKARGYRFVTIPELLALGTPSAAPPLRLDDRNHRK